MPVRPEEAIARVVLAEYLELRARERLAITTWNHGLPWARALVVEARRRSALPWLVLEDEEAFFRALEVSPKGRPMPRDDLPPRAVDARVMLDGPLEFPRLLGLSSAERDALVLPFGPGAGVPSGRGAPRSLRLSVAAATPPAALRLGVDAETWREELVDACLVGPARLRRTLAGMEGRLRLARRLRLRHPNGTDLEAELRTGRLTMDDGRPEPGAPYPAELPAGRLVAFLKSGTARGAWEANRPVYDRYAAPPVQLGARLRFARGRLREFEFDRGGEGFAATYSHGGLGRDEPSALVFGANPRIARAPELGDLARGAVTLLLGNDARWGGRNRARSSVRFTIAAPDVDLDGRPWLVQGRPVEAP